MGFLLQAGLFGLIGAILSGLIGWGKDRDIGLKEFQYGLIKEALSISDSQIRENQVKLLYEVNLLDDKFISSDTLIYRLTFQRGKADARAASSLAGAIKEFYLVENRVPKEISELRKGMNVEKIWKYFDGNIHYYATSERSFRLLTPGGDGVLFTSDDKKIDFSSLGLSN
ncbi:hypothetical protein [Roseivirga sp.]|uniref:hypothetical protein n=1 Tax=Roseivirga sp. TaxID=1964215 RepID=UPI002B266D64|nr:hypothetical protein [Roseivirga sp.]